MTNKRLWIVTHVCGADGSSTSWRKECTREQLDEALTDFCERPYAMGPGDQIKVQEYMPMGAFNWTLPDTPVEREGDQPAFPGMM